MGTEALAAALMALLQSQNELLKEIVSKADPATITAILNEHEARIVRGHKFLDYINGKIFPDFKPDGDPAK